MRRVRSLYSEVDVPMKHIRAALFDLDGTLTNTLQDIADAMNRALTAHQLPTWQVEDYKYLVGQRRKNSGAARRARPSGACRACAPDLSGLV